MAKLLLLVACLLLPARAQPLFDPALDACVQAELRSASRKSALGGLVSSLAENLAENLVNRKTDDQRAGRAMRMSLDSEREDPLGPALGYYGALDQCLTQQPAWIPGSRLVAGADWETMAAIHAYRPEQGPLARAVRIDAPEQIAPGNELRLEGRLLLLTPQGEAAEIQIERKLYLRADGREQELRWPGPARETRQLPAGEAVDTARLPVPRELPAGALFRYVLTVRVGAQPPSSTECGVAVR